MKRFICIVSVVAAIALALAVVPAVVIDPYNVIHWEHLRSNGVEPNKSFIKTKYVVRNPDRFDAYMFGSSRVSAIHTNLIQGEKIYNMTCSEGVPYDHLTVLETFLENGVQVKKIYIGVDSLSYTIDGRQHENSPLRCSYRRLHHNPETFLSLFGNPLRNVASLYTTFFSSKKSKYDPYEFYNYGWHSDYTAKTTIDWAKATPSMGAQYMLEETLHDLRAIKALCDQNGIEMVVFTNPMYELTYRASLERDYFAFLRGLVEITDYYNFSGLNDITTNKKNYLDTSHYNAYIGDRIIRVIAEGERYDDLYAQGFGWYVTKENIDDLLRLLQDQTARK